MPHLFDSGCPRIMPPDKSLNSTLYGRYRVSTNSKIKRQNFLDFQISIFTKNQNSRALYPISLPRDTLTSKYSYFRIFYLKNNLPRNILSSLKSPSKSPSKSPPKKSLKKPSKKPSKERLEEYRKRKN